MCTSYDIFLVFRPGWHKYCPAEFSSESMSGSSHIPHGGSDLPLKSEPSAFERWRRKAMLVTGLGITEQERLEYLQHSHLEDCERRKEHLMNSSTPLPLQLTTLNTTFS